MKTIGVKELASQQDAELIDVRMPTEFRSLHAECARNVPLNNLNPREIMAKRNGRGAEPLYVICHSGSRSQQACQKFIEAGFENVVSVEGGTSAWDAAGLPVVRGKKSLSLQQQMQLVAGSMVIAGVALGYAWTPTWFGLSGFVGLGLLFAGATGYCPLSSLIAQMPWNQCEGGGQCSP